MENALPSDPAPPNNTEPFTLVALASTDLTAGEMVHFDVDSAGNITSPNFVFTPTTPRVAKISVIGAVTLTSVTAQSVSAPPISQTNTGPAVTGGE